MSEAERKEEKLFFSTPHLCFPLSLSTLFSLLLLLLLPASSRKKKNFLIPFSSFPSVEDLFNVAYLQESDECRENGRKETRAEESL